MAQAARLYWQAAEQGLAKAKLHLGTCYEMGDGVPQNKAQAARLYRQAADQGHASAQCALGSWYEHGKGVRYNMGKAVALSAGDRGGMGSREREHWAVL
jgi:TPR repeat protein